MRLIAHHADNDLIQIKYRQDIYLLILLLLNGLLCDTVPKPNQPNGADTMSTVILPIGRLFDSIKEKKKIRTDSELAAKLGVHKPVIAKTRAGALPVGPNMILRLHETFGIPVSSIRKELEG